MKEGITTLEKVLTTRVSPKGIYDKVLRVLQKRPLFT